MVRDRVEPEHETSRKELLDRVGPEADRRGVLRGTAAAVVGGLAGVFGMSGSAAADRTGEQGVQAAFREHGGDLLAELSDRGYLDSPSVDDLQAAGRLAPAGTGLGSAAYRNPGSAAAAVTELEDGRQLVARVEPDADRRYALVKPAGQLSEGDTVTVLAETDEGWQTSTSEVGTEDYYCDTDCYDGVCGCYQYYIDHTFQTCYSTSEWCGSCYSYCPY